MTCWYSLSPKFYKYKRYILSNAKKKTTTLPMSLIDNEITKHVLIWFTVNVAYSPSQHIQGQATMSEPPQHSNWQAYKVIDGNTNQTANGSSCAIIEFYKRYTSVWLSNDYSTLHILKSIFEMKEVSLEKKANLFLSHK